MSLLFALLIIGLVSLSVVSALPFRLYTYCPNSTFFSPTNTALQSSFASLLSNLSATANLSSTPTFDYSTTGSPAVYGLYLCRGDDDATTCRDCVATATADLSKNCPLSSQVVSWYDECMIRYCNVSFFGQLDANIHLPMWNTNNITGNITHFNEVLSATLADVTTLAARGGTTLKFATKQEKVNEFQSLYTLGQCTPDLSGSDCYTCLQVSINYLPGVNSQGARVLFYSCNLRYEIYHFYNDFTTLSPIFTYCPTSDFFPPAEASTYTDTIGALLNSLSSSANTSTNPGFHNTTQGDSPTLYGLYLCRGDIPTSTCRDCVAAASTYLPRNCTRGKQALVLYDVCMIRYSNQSFFGLLDTNIDPLYTHITPQTGSGLNSSNLASFGVAFEQARGKVIAAATEQGTNLNAKMIATDQEIIGSTPYTLYMMAQCTPDLSVEDCKRCLKTSGDTLNSCCLVNQGAAVYYFSCYLRFEMNQFYNINPNDNSTTVVPIYNNNPGPGPGNPDTPNKNKPKRRTLVIVGSLITAIVVLLLGLALWFKLFDKMKSTATYTDLDDIMTVEALQMDFNKIRIATQSFSIDNKLGQGGFGSVYKGKLENGQEIAVKRLSENSHQGIAEFKTEVLIVAKLQHRNLVKLLGFCVAGKERILVYEFLTNSSLDKLLSDPTKRMLLKWEMRFKIICGIAKGLMYLHEDSRLKVIHRDLKSSNILLDEDFHPKISDFGLAKLFGADQTQAVTDLIAGTYGYMAPEYILMGHYSIKSDVYSFGVMILEIISGQRNKYTNLSSTEEALLYRAWKLWNEGEALNLVDETLNRSYAEDDVVKCVHIGMLCIQESAAKRPNMSSVVAALGGQTITLPLPSPPNFFNDTYTSSIDNTNNTCVELRQQVSVAETSDITDLLGR